jgi:hypothetical protein
MMQEAAVRLLDGATVAIRPLLKYNPARPSVRNSRIVRVTRPSGSGAVRSFARTHKRTSNCPFLDTLGSLAHILFEPEVVARFNHLL